MKKLSLVLFAMIVLLFASCGSSGTQEYKDAKKLLTKFEKAIDKAKTCEELESVFDEFEEEAELLADKDYDKKQSMTDEEDDEISDLAKQLEKKYDKKEDKLCD